MYARTSNMIRLNGELSNELVSKNGVKQGDNFSPTGFNSYIDSLITEIRNMKLGIPLTSKAKVSVLAYADDIVLIGSTSMELERMLQKLSEWCIKWRVSVNVSKTKIVHFRKQGTPCVEYDFCFQNSRLDIVKEYKYLGVNLNYYLDSAFSSELLAKAASRSLGQMINKTRNNYDLGYHSYTKLYNCTVVPILDYSIGAWGTGAKGNPHKKLDQVQNRAMRYFCGVPRSTPLAGLIGDMGWSPGVVRRDVESLRMYNQLVRMNKTCITRQIFDSECEQCLNNGWASNVRNIISSIGKIECWDNCTPVNLQLAKKMLNDWYTCAWKNEIANKSKLKVYSQIKSVIEPEGYIKFNLDKAKRSKICSLRCGILGLEVE